MAHECRQDGCEREDRRQASEARQVYAIATTERVSEQMEAFKDGGVQR